MVGPFIFFDHMGPADFASGRGIEGHDDFVVFLAEERSQNVGGSFSKPSDE